MIELSFQVLLTLKNNVEKKFSGEELFSGVKEYTGDNTLPKGSFTRAVTYLEYQGLVSYQQWLGILSKTGYPFDDVQITVQGIAYVEITITREETRIRVESKNGDTPQISIGQIVHVSGDNPGNIVSSKDGDITINTSNSFENLKKRINEDKMLSNEGKTEITRRIDELSSEIQKEDVDKTKVTEIVDWINKNAPGWVVTGVIALIPRIPDLLEALKNAIPLLFV